MNALDDCNIWIEFQVWCCIVFGILFKWFGPSQQKQKEKHLIFLRKVVKKSSSLNKQCFWKTLPLDTFSRIFFIYFESIPFSSHTLSLRYYSFENNVFSSAYHPSIQISISFLKEAFWYENRLLCMINIWIYNMKTKKNVCIFSICRFV